MIKQRLPKGYRVVDYFGIPIQIKTADTWVATDKNGAVYQYEKEPAPSVSELFGDNRFVPAAGGGEYQVVQGVELELGDFNWKETCVFFASTEPRVLTSYIGEHDFHGVKVMAPNKGYLSMTSFGGVWWSEYMPSLLPTEGRWSFGESDSLLVARVSVPVDWKESLVGIVFTA